MATYSKEFKEEALKLSNEVGVKTAAAQLGIPYYTLAVWTDGEFAYSIKLTSGETKAVWNELLQRVQP